METTLIIPQFDTIIDKIDYLTKAFEDFKNGKSKNTSVNLTRKQAAEKLNICVTTLDNHRRNKLITGFKIGKKRLYTSEEIENLSNK